MKTFPSAVFTWLRDAVSGCRRLRRYTHSEAHRGSSNRDGTIGSHYVPSSQANRTGPGGF